MYSYQWIDDPAGLPPDITDLVVTVSRSDPFVGLPPDPTAEQSGELTERLASALGSGRGHLLAIRSASGAAAGCVVMTVAATPNQAHIAELTVGAIHPDHRGQSIVGEAFAEIARRSEKLGVELLRLDVREGIPAEKVWRWYGFTEYGRLPDYGRAGGESYAGVYLAQSVRDLSARVTRDNMEA
jgi:ribosomal protein S18 acetylase RimI-like enzyme